MPDPVGKDQQHSRNQQVDASCYIVVKAKEVKTGGCEKHRFGGIKRIDQGDGPQAVDK